MDRKQDISQLKNGLSFTAIRCEINRILVTQGTRNGLVYFVESGWVKVSKHSESGKDNIIDICGPGEFIGLPTLFHDIEFPVSAITLTPGRLLAFKKDCLEHFLLQHPEIMATLMVELGQIVLKLREVKAAANRQDAYRQVLDILVHFAKIFGSESPKGREIPFNLTQQDIADLIGLSRPRVNICLKGLLGQGYILRQGKHYVIPDAFSVISMPPLWRSQLL